MPNIEQAPGNLNLTITRGDTFSLAFDFSIDLTGYTFEGKVGVKILTITAVDLAAGKINISLTGAQTNALSIKPIAWYLKWTDSGGATRKVLTGDVTVI